MNVKTFFKTNSKHNISKNAYFRISKSLFKK